jgi:hypothetical protein
MQIEEKHSREEEYDDQFNHVIEYHDLEYQGMHRFPVDVLRIIAQFLDDNRIVAGVPYFVLREGIRLYRNLVIYRHWRSDYKITSHAATLIAENLVDFHYTSEINPCLDIQIMESFDPIAQIRDGYYDGCDDAYAGDDDYIGYDDTQVVCDDVYEDDNDIYCVYYDDYDYDYDYE